MGGVGVASRGAWSIVNGRGLLCVGVAYGKWACSIPGGRGLQ